MPNFWVASAAELAPSSSSTAAWRRPPSLAELHARPRLDYRAEYSVSSSFRLKYWNVFAVRWYLLCASAAERVPSTYSFVARLPRILLSSSPSEDLSSVHQVSRDLPALAGVIAALRSTAFLISHQTPGLLHATVLSHHSGAPLKKCCSSACVQCVGLTGACAACSHCWAAAWVLSGIDHSHAATPQLCVSRALHVLSSCVLCLLLGAACRRFAWSSWSLVDACATMCVRDGLAASVCIRRTSAASRCASSSGLARCRFPSLARHVLRCDVMAHLLSRE